MIIASHCFIVQWCRTSYLNPRRTILKFSGFKRVSATYIGPVINSTTVQRDKWTKQVVKLASKRAVG
ncbi:hypothetical protein RJD39_03370 [Vibrio scophthalmi]|uniref:hypothetical protein n=1 Tax=Vibrio scophthalmi TaxID=45658 RepID=UPI003872FAA8